MATLTSSDVGSGGGVTVETIFDRRIDFHPARKHYSAVSNACSNGFFLETLNPSTGNQKLQRESAFGGEKVNGTPVKRMDAGIEFFEHGLDQELGFRITFRRIGAGLANLGNTCFLNSVLQCLTYTEPFAAYLQSGKHKSSCRTAGFCALCALQNHVMSALQSTGKIVSPFHLVKNLRCISRNFRNSRQEDAHEYMVNLLESMHKCCLPSGIPSESPTAYEKSLVHKIFGGRLRSQVKCMQCQYSSNKYDPFLDLSLEIAKADTVKKALANFTAVEKLDGGEKQYQCQRCKQKVRALKQLTINKPPHVLTVHLKRFSSFIPGQKIDRKVQFEPFLDLKPFVSDPNEGNLKYTLYGVLVHAGWSTHSGHYYCFVRTSSGMWHSLDDNQVRQVSEKTVLAQKAYMLFYVRDRAPLVKKENNVANLSGIKMNPIQTSQLKLNGMNNSIIQKSENMKVLAVTTNVSKIGNGNGNPVPVQKPSELQTKLEGPVKVVLPVVEPNVPLKESEKCEKEIEEKKCDVISNHTNDGEDKVVTLLENKADCILTKPKDDGPKVDEESKKEEIEIKIIEGPIKNQSGLAQIKIEKISHKSENKSKKLTKRSSKSTMCIGRNTLFLTTLMLRKSKKFKRAKRRRLVTKQGDDVAVSEPQESTSVSNESEFVKKEDKSHKKKRGKKSREKKNGVDDVAKVDSDLLETKKNDDVAKEEVSCKRESIGLLLSGLTEIKVPGWDEVPRVETSNIEPSEKNNIGYVLDEWDEEYDRGRRKKVKKSREEIEGPNPFQEMEDMKTRKKMKKLGHFGSGNQPMRI